MRPTQVDEISSAPCEPGQLAISCREVCGAGTLAAAKDDTVVDLIAPAVFEPFTVSNGHHANSSSTANVSTATTMNHTVQASTIRTARP
jgi:hypothetical protein